MDGCGNDRLTFFSEKEEALRLIRIIVDEQIACSDSPSSSSSPPPSVLTSRWENSFEELQILLAKYQEQPTLLNSSLDELVTPLATKMAIVAEEIVTNQKSVVTGTSIVAQLDFVCKCIQLICRVRGFKHILKFLPHEVRQMEICLHLLDLQDRSNHITWETRFVLLLWLSILSLIPFDICSLDSTLTTFSSSSSSSSAGLARPGGGEDSKLVVDIYEVCKTYLSESGPTRDAAGVCLSSLLTRPDMDSRLLTQFSDFANELIESWGASGEDATADFRSEYFKLVGVLHTVALIFKKGHRENLLFFSERFLQSCLALKAQQNQTVVRKLCVKILQRIGMAYSPPKLATWRYQRGFRSLEQSLNPEGRKESEAGRCEGREDKGDDIDDEDATVVSEVEEIIGQLISGLGDKDTVVRWSAAKGIGRISMRLPRAFADEVIGAILQQFSDDEDDDSSWHGCCLAIAELSRRGLLLPDRLSEVIPLVQRAVHFDVVRGQHSVGTHVRDAACYVCWAFARAYSPEIMKPYLNDMTISMLLCAIFDREVNCRRAASAAFQENVGRQGHENFVFGIEIITLADYFSLGNRTYAYLNIAPEVAAFDARFLESFTKHLSESKVFHWEESMRMLAAQGLAALSPLSKELSLRVLRGFIPECTSTALNRRHGAILAISELVLALANDREGFTFDADTADHTTGGEPLLSERIADVVPSLEKARLFRGKGGEILRQACCHLIENIARAGLKIAVKAQASLAEFLNENLRQPHELIQQAAARAIRIFLYVYFPVKQTPTQRLQDLTVCKYLSGLRTEVNVAVTRGYTTGLGTLPAKLLLRPPGRLDEVFGCLEEMASSERLFAGEPDVETRRNAVRALVEISERLNLFGAGRTTSLLGSDSEGRESLAQRRGKVLGCLIRACSDYSVDKRGDTGSWCRIAAMEGFERLMHSVAEPLSARGVLLPMALEWAGDFSAFGNKDNNNNIDDNNNSSSSSSYSSELVDSSTGVLVMTPLGFGYVSGVDPSGQVLEVDFPVQSIGQALSTDSLSFKRVSEGGGVASKSFRMRSHLATPLSTVALSLAASGVSLAATEVEEVVGSETHGFDAATVQRVIGELLKQMSEKLDAVRDISGNILQRLLSVVDRIVPGVEGIDLIRASLSSSEGINWAHPGYVFPFLLKLLDSEAYFHSIVSGWVISMGGLTETVVREASAVLTGWCRSASQSNDLVVVPLERLLGSLCRLFAEHAHDDRVILPLLKSLNTLLSQGSLDRYLLRWTEGGGGGVGDGNGSPSSWTERLFSALRGEVAKSSDIGKLRVCTDVLVLLQPISVGSPSTSIAIFRQIIVLVGHKYPRVRKYAAEQAYLLLISIPAGSSGASKDVSAGSSPLAALAGLMDNLSTVLEVLVSVEWDKSVAVAREERVRLFGLIGWEISKPSASDLEGQEKKKASSKRSDELDSYGSLVREAGY